MSAILSKSNKKDKKYMLKHDNKTIHFGANGMRDFTLINKPSSSFYISNKEDREKVKKNYRSRHQKDPINKKFSPASLSWYLLWNKTTLGASIKDYEKRFNVNIINKT